MDDGLGAKGLKHTAQLRQLSNVDLFNSQLLQLGWIETPLTVSQCVDHTYFVVRLDELPA